MSSSGVLRKGVIQRAKASVEYRQLQSDLEKAVWLNQNLNVSQVKAAAEFGLTRHAVARAIAASRQGRDVGVNGRPQYLNHLQREELHKLMVAQGRSLDSMNALEVQQAVRRIH